MQITPDMVVGALQGLYVASRRHEAASIFRACLAFLEAGTLNESTDTDIDSLLVSAMLALTIKDDDALKHSLAQLDKDATVQAANLACAHLVRMTACGIASESYFATVWDACSGMSASFDATWRKIGHIQGLGSMRHALRHIGTQASSEVTITQIALCLLRAEDDIQKLSQYANQCVQPDVSLMIALFVTGLRNGSQPFSTDDTVLRDLTESAERIIAVSD